MAIDDYQYIGYVEAVVLHFELMQILGEIRYGVFDRSLIESALARPQQAAAYDNADIFDQAATLCYGLIKNHPWIGGNKRTATYLTESFLRRNGHEFAATFPEMLSFVLAIEADEWQQSEIAMWMRSHTKSFTPKK